MRSAGSSHSSIQVKDVFPQVSLVLGGEGLWFNWPIPVICNRVKIVSVKVMAKHNDFKSNKSPCKIYLGCFYQLCTNYNVHICKNVILRTSTGCTVWTVLFMLSKKCISQSLRVLWIRVHKEVNFTYIFHGTYSNVKVSKHVLLEY